MKAERGPWPERAVARVGEAVTAWRHTFPGHKPLLLAWDPAATAPQALLDLADHEYRLTLAPAADPDHTDRCLLETHFLSWSGIPADDALPLLPLDDARRLYNLLASCEDGVQLRLRPDPAGRGIAVVGARTCLPVEGFCARSLGDALTRLFVTTYTAWGWLAEHQGDDRWAADGGGE